MDANDLLRCFQGTLEAEQTTRVSAETRLRELETQPGFLGACVDILGADLPLGIRQAAAVYFKNHVVRRWSHPYEPVDAGEKPVIKERIIPVLAAADSHVKPSLVVVLRHLVDREFLAWPELLDHVARLLQKPDEASLHTGVLVFAEVTRHFRWKENKDRQAVLDPLILLVFPHLLAVGTSIAGSALTETTAEILKLILKAYKFVTFYDLPVVLQTHDSLAAWAELHCAVAQMQPPEYAAHSEGNQLQVAKAYKRAVGNMDRLFKRYGLRLLSLRVAYDEFRALFQGMVPHLMKVFLNVAEQWCSGTRWIPPAMMYNLLDFLLHCVTQKEPWRLLEPYFETLVLHLVFPLLCPSPELLDLFDTSPQEYINSKLDSYDSSNPDIAALGLLVTLANKRPHTLQAIMSVALTHLSGPLNDETAKKREGAIRMVGAISPYLTDEKNEANFPQIESFVLELVLPNASAPYEFLQARTLSVLSCFSTFPFSSWDPLKPTFDVILKPFHAGVQHSLPVMVECALALQAFLHVAEFKAKLGPLIINVMARLLELSLEIDNDAISFVMQECVENFSLELQPFGVDLVSNLVSRFLQLANEIKEADAGTDDFDNDSGDKVLAASGLLSTMLTVLLSFENSREVCIKLEETLAPVIEFVLTNKLDDFLCEVGELLENSIFLLRAVSPIMWRNYSLLIDNFHNGLALMYLDELSQCLKYFVIYGHEEFKKPDLANSFTQLIVLAVTLDEEGCLFDDLVVACDLALNFVLATHQLDQQLMNCLLPVLATKEDVRKNSLTVNLVDFFVACLVYEPASVIRALQALQLWEHFMVLWTGLIPLLKRVFDIKLSAMGLMSLAGTDIEFPIGAQLAILYKNLPAAIEKFEERKVDFCDSNYAEKYDSNYIDFLNEEDVKISGSHFDEPIEDPLSHTPIDSIDGFQLLKDFIASNPKQSLFVGLSDEEKKVLSI